MFLARQRVVAWVLPLWAVAVMGGMAGLAAYEGKPGVDKADPRVWPRETGVAKNSAGPTIVVALHPHCPCSRATLAELEKVLAQASGTEVVKVLAVLPDGETDEFVETALIERAREIPGVAVLIDRGAREAQRFAATTSGHVLVYATGGELRFSGGITASRGHEGENAGADAVLTVLRKGKITSELATSPTFGCSLVSPANGGAKEGS